MATLAERTARLEAELEAIGDRVSALERELWNGNAERPSARTRLHRLENDAAAAKIAATALEHAHEARKAAEGRRWTKREKLLAAAVALPSAVLPWVNLYLVTRH